MFTIIFSIIFTILTMVLLGYDFYEEKFKLRKRMAFGLIWLLIILFACFEQIEVGQVGIKTRFGKIVDTNMSSGINYKMPFEKIERINIKVQKIEVESNGASKDLQDVKTKIVVNYKVKSNKAINLYKNLGNKYEETVLEPAVKESVKAVLSEYTAEQLITKRKEVSNKSTQVLQDKVEKYGLLIDNFNITEFNFSSAFNNAIEEKQVAEQKVLKAKQDLEKAKVDANKKVAEAKAEAESLKAQKQEITKDLLKLREIEAQLKAIEKWNGSLPSTMFGNSIPFVNVGGGK